MSPVNRPFNAPLALALLVLVSPGLVTPAQAWGRFGGFAGGGYRFGGGADDWRGGYNGYHPLYGAGARPAWGNLNRSIDVNTNFYNRPYNGWHPGWANGGYWSSRPWNAGWYRWAPATWSWWGPNATTWGLAGLATGAAITSLVNTAAMQQSPVFLVPQTSYQLNYGSVEAVGTYGASFSYQLNGTPLLGAANCQQGLLDGQVPQSAQQAQLLNAVCHVAYGPSV